MSSASLPDLVGLFAGAPSGARGPLRAALAAALERARRRWPGVTVADEVFARALAERAGSEEPVAWLGRVHAEDLYLCCACVAGDPGALSVLDRDYLARLRDELARSPTLGPHADEAHQQIRVRLLVAGPDGSPPRLAGYKGQGPLLAWLRLTMTRLVLNGLQGDTRQSQLRDALAQEAAPPEDPELAFLRRRYQRELGQAMTEALATLGGDERAILRLHFLDGLSAEETGRLFKVSGRTIQRRINETRQAIMKRTRALLRGRLGVKTSQIGTLMRLAQSDLHVSLQRLLRDDPRSE